MFEGILGIKKPIVGLDIGHKTLKIVQLKGRGKNASLVSASEVPIAEDTLSRDGIKEKQQLVAKILEGIKSAKPHKVSAKIISSALPESFVFTKTIDLPQMNTKEINQNIPAQAKEFFPIPIEETYLDWQIVGVSVQKKMLEIFVVAGPKALVDALVETVRLAGLELGSLESKPISVARALVDPEDPNTYLILDIGAKTSGLICYDDKTIKLTSTLTVGGDNLTKNFADAIKSIGIEILNFNKYYQNRLESSKTFKKILLAGGGANIKNIAESLEKTLKIKTEIGMPIIRLGSYDPKFATALGLAMKEI